MELGEKLKQARLAAGLSQRQLCGSEITRNMLSQIENGSARPSMATLRYLADRLEKPLSWFLDVQGEQENQWLESALLLQKAEEAIAQGKEILASQLLEKADAPAPGLQRRRLLLLGQLPGANLQEICQGLPSLDGELLLRAKAALEAGQLERCGNLLMAVEAQEQEDWFLLRGQWHLGRKEYAQAANCFHKMEKTAPKRVVPLLEQCYRELGDFQTAYRYACMQKK